MNIEKKSLELTTSLLKVQEENTPITFNSILSAILLNEIEDTVKMSSLVEKASTIFEYIREKPQAFTYMTISANQTIIEKELLALGFKLEGLGSKKCKVLLSNL